MVVIARDQRKQMTGLVALRAAIETLRSTPQTIEVAP